MKRNIINGIILVGALALGSCSTQNKIASANVNDDVYGSKVVAGEQPVYVAQTNDYRHDDANTEDYSYYDSYTARLNRFYNYSPFVPSYYDDFYYGGLSPYYSGLSVGIGLGYGGYGYSPYGYGGFGYSAYYGGYGYSPYGYGGYGYSPYGGYYGSIYGYGASPYWGAYSYGRVVASSGTPRPFRGNGNPGVSYGSYGRGLSTGYANGAGISYGGRPSRVGNPYAGRTGTTNNNGGYTQTSRPSRGDNSTYTRQPQPQAQPQQQPQSYTPPPSNSGSSNSGGGGGSRGGGGGGRPSRP
jgi:hypothetical protein